ncbi:MAG: TlpA family protein disulfide reductase [Gammaproteobacteria bacterium]|nr:MAG: TlpA family protein disulfide reductase [Gammaproteobacteria bacterium]
MSLPLRALPFLLLLSVAGLAAEERTIGLPSGDQIPLTVYPATGGDRLLLWLPSEFGLSPRQRPVAEALAKQGIEVWIPDLHAAWFLAAGRYSLNEIPPAAITELVHRAVASGRKVFLMAPGRTAGLALRALRRYQQKYPDTDRIGGLITVGPRLFLRTPQGGEPVELLPIARASNVPLYILQPRNAGGFWHLRELIEPLEAGGAPVYTHILEGVRDGFNLRDDPNPQEEALTTRLPTLIEQAMDLLEPAGGLPAHAAPLPGEDRAPEVAERSTLLNPYPEGVMAPPLRLPLLGGGSKNLEALRGRPVLVNFWAVWCPPCVEELPSLQRLRDKRRAAGLEILAVEVGDAPAKVEEFLANKAVDFPVLLDPQGNALARWGVHAFPTTFVIDRQGRIRYAGFGAFTWDSPEMLELLDPLLGE